MPDDNIELAGKSIAKEYSEEVVELAMFIVWEQLEPSEKRKTLELASSILQILNNGD